VEPDYGGGGVVNVVAEIERRLTGGSPSPGLASPLASRLPDAASYVLLLVDGLGDDQLVHPAAATLRGARAGTVDTGFPATTSTTLATVATGLAPRSHGVLGHLLWLPELGAVVNTLRWVLLDGRPSGWDTRRLLPRPTLWERLRAGGIEPITVQPADFDGSPLSRGLYAGCRFEGVATVEELVAASVELAAVPGRLVFTYLPQVDFAAHVWGQRSRQYAAALSLVDTAWSRLAARLPPGAALVGTADHGLVDCGEAGKIIVRDRRFDPLVLYGDPRAVLARGDGDLVGELAAATGGRTVTGDALARLFGPPGADHPDLAARIPDAAVLAPAGKVILPRGFDRRLVGYHGGLDPRERRVPLLVAAQTAAKTRSAMNVPTPNASP